MDQGSTGSPWRCQSRRGGRHAGNEPDSAGDIVGGEELKAVASVGGFDSDRAGWFSPPPPPPFYSMQGS